MIKKFMGIIFLAIIVSSFISVTNAATTYRNGNQLLADYNSLENSYPNLIDHIKVGETVNGQDLNLYRIGNSNAPRIYVDGSIHGMEVVTSEALYYAVETIVTSESGIFHDILEQNYLLVLPIVNLDSFGKSYPSGRYNANGVDLNRQFDRNWKRSITSGPYPLSEPESQTIHNILSDYKPVWYMNLHSGWQRVTPARDATTSEKNEMKQVYYDYQNIVRSSWGYSPIVWSLSPEYDGMMASDEGYMMGAKTFEIELSKSHKPTYSSTQTLYARHVLALITAMCHDARSDVTPPPLPEPEIQTMHVESIDIEARRYGRRRRYYRRFVSEILVKDYYGNPVDNVRVYATLQWNGGSRTYSKTTKSNGIATFYSYRVYGSNLNFNININSVQKTDWAHDESSSVTYAEYH